MPHFLLDSIGAAGDASLCFLENFVKGIEMDAYRVGLGERVGRIYPKDARIYMSKENPGIKLSDFIGNTRSMLVASKRLRALIEKHCPDQDIEYLPFTLYDHRKRPYSDEYCIVNPIGVFDCLDFEKSGVVFGKEDPDLVIRIKEYVLDRRKMNGAPQLFRIAKKPADIVFGPDLAKDVGAGKLTNVKGTKLRFNDEV